MNQPLSEFSATCDEAYSLALAENQHLKHAQQAPDGILRGRKQELLARLNKALPALHDMKASHLTADARKEVARLRERILQTLHLDRENEQLLLRGSLMRPGAAVPTAPATHPASAARAYMGA